MGNLYLDCGCDPKKTTEEVCDKTNGHCMCKDNFSGEDCQRCAGNYYGYPNCNGMWLFCFFKTVSPVAMESWW